MSKFIKMYKLNICMLLYMNYISVKLKKEKKKLLDRNVERGQEGIRKVRDPESRRKSLS